MLDLKPGDLVLAWPGVFSGSCSDTPRCSEVTWHVGTFVTTNRKWPQNVRDLLYGVAIPDHGALGYAWWCDEDKVIPIPKGATSVQIEALRIMYAKV